MVEGIQRVLLSESVANPSDLIAALILQYFERPESYIEGDQDGKEKHRAKYSSQSKGIRKIRLLLDLFFGQYSKLDLEKAEELFKGSVKAIYSVIRGGMETKKVSMWEHLNPYKILAKFANHLHIAHNTE